MYPSSVLSKLNKFILKLPKPYYILLNEFRNFKVHADLQT